jgi:transcription elongation factor GreA
VALFTKEGFDNLHQRLKEAEDRRPQVLQSLVRAREMGDLSENGAYKGARFELSRIDSDIRHLKNQIKYARIIEKPANNDTVQIGHTVLLRRIN